MPFRPFVYPTPLTNKDWQKKKGVIGKAKKTGVGESLDALEKVLAKSAFTAADPVALVDGSSDPLVVRKKVEGVTKTLAASAKAAAPKVTAVDAAVNKAIPEFTGSTGQSVRKHLESLKGETKSLNASLAAFPKQVEAEMLVAYGKKLRTLSSYNALKDSAPIAADVVKTLLGQIKSLEQAPALAGVHERWGADGPARKLTTWCKLWDQLVMRDFPELGKAAYSQKAMTTLFTLPWMQQVGNEPNSDATKLLARKIDEGTSEDRAVTQFCLEYSRSVLESRGLIVGMQKVWTVLAKY